MLGPVFFLEWHNACRRGRHHLFRFVYALVLAWEFAFFLYLWYSRAVLAPAFLANDTPPQRTTIILAWSFFTYFAAQQLILLVLMTPALAAGSVTDDKSRGTLTLVLTTGLTSGEIILGKWLSHFTQALVLTSPGWLLLVFLAALGDIPSIFLFLNLVETTLLAMALAAGSLLASVWARKTTSAVLALYLTAGLCGLAAWTSGALNRLDAISFGYMAVAHSFKSLASAQLPRLFALLLGVTALCLGIAIWRLRPAVASQLEGGRPRRSRWMHRPPCTDVPMRWKERYAGELGFLSYARWLPYWFRILVVLVLSLFLSVVFGSSDERHLAHCVGFMIAVGLLVGVRASGVITGEREQQTWETLLLTTLETKQLIRGKLWGIVDSVRPYLVAYLVPVLLVSMSRGVWAVFCVAFSWAASWGLLYYHCANGVYWSAHSSSSWQSLLKTQTTGWWAVFYRLVIAGLPGCAVVNMFASLYLRASAGYVAILIGLVGPTVLMLFAVVEYLLQEAEKHVARQERVPRQNVDESVRDESRSAKGDRPGLEIVSADGSQ